MAKHLYIGAVLVLATLLIPLSHAKALPATLSLSPSSGSFTVGNTISVDIIENSGLQPVYAVQANVSYPSNLLSLVGVVNSPSFTIDPGGSKSDGYVQVARGTLAPATGKRTVASLQFLVTAPGNAAIAFAGGSVVLGGSGDLLNGSVAGANFNLATPVVARLVPKPHPVPPAPPQTSNSSLNPPSKPAKPASYYHSTSDFNRNGYVDIYDLTDLIDNYFSHKSKFDLDKDSSINTIDLSIFVSNYGR